MTLEQFRIIKQKIIDILNQCEEKMNSENKSDNYYDEIEILYNSYKSLVTQLLSSDLSQIPFEEWDGLVLEVENLDFSKTHANIDFSLIKSLRYHTINLKGCNVRGIEYIFYDENTFDEEFKRNHPNYFPDNSIPKDVRDRFYQRKLEFTDLKKYPSLRVCINKYSLNGGLSSRLVHFMGFESALRLFDESPEFVIYITDKDNRIIDFRDEQFDTNKTFEEKKKIIYESVINNLRKEGNRDFPKKEIFPSDFIQTYSLVFENDEKLPQHIVDDYYSGKLTIRQIRMCKDVFQTKDLSIGVRNERSTTNIIRVFGSVWNFISQVPQELDFIVSEYLEKFYNDEIEKLKSMDPKDIIADAIKTSRELEYQIDSLSIYSQYVSLDKIINDENIVYFINKCGFELLKKYNKNCENVLNGKFFSGFKGSLLECISKYFVQMKDSIIINGEEDFNLWMEKIIVEIRKSNNFIDNKMLSEYRDKLAVLYPSQFLDYNLAIEILSEKFPNPQDKLSSLIKGFNGEIREILLIADECPRVIELINNKNLIINESFSPLYQKIYDLLGVKMFLYGSALLNLIDNTFWEEQNKLLFELENNENYEGILNQRIYELLPKTHIYNFDIRNFPESFKASYPKLYLNENAPSFLADLLYQGKLDPFYLQSNPKWKNYLIQIDYIKFFNTIEIEVYNSNSGMSRQRMNLYDVLSMKFTEEEILELFTNYGSYFSDITRYFIISPLALDIGLEKDKFYESILDYVYNCIENTGLLRNIRELPDEFKNKYPDIYLDKNAPDDLKRHFYFEGKPCYPLTFQLLKENKEWLKHLKDKNMLAVLNSLGSELLPRDRWGAAQVTSNNLKMLFHRYGQEEAVRIGIKNPEAVMEMLKNNQLELLCQWYEKLNFIPHYVVMTNFPIEQSDKFISSGKKWSQIMRVAGYDSNEKKEAILKASMCFGVFENDDEGFNKLIQLFTDIPSKLSEQEMKNLLEQCNEMIASNNENKEICQKALELLKSIYRKNDDGTYTLTVNTQQNKEITSTIREFMELVKFPKVINPELACEIFGNFETKYSPEFRDFLLKNLDKILESSEYISYINLIQKQWAEIKILNSNRVLTLELAIAFVKEQSYNGVEIGNERLAAESSNEENYGQEVFDTLQEIYNYGKQRVFNSIPRVTGTKENFVYEVVRFDDPIALVIGPRSDCCQELGDNAETCMEHSVVDKHGRLFVIRDADGNIVAQSWMWRNQNILCFDNIEVPEKAFKRAEQSGISRDEFTDSILSTYKQAALELMEKDEKMYLKLLEEGKITREQYEALKLGKITVGIGNNDIAESLKRNVEKDQGVVTRPLDFVPPVKLKMGLYLSDSNTQYIIAGNQDVVVSTEPTMAVYQDEFMVYDDSNITEKESILLQKLEYVTDQDNYAGYTRIENKENIISEIAYNYDMNPETTRIIMNANFAIIFEVKEECIIIGDILYNTNVRINGKVVDITDKVTMQIRMALEQIGISGKEIDISRLDNNQLEMYNRAISLDDELDIERGISRGSR